MSKVLRPQLTLEQVMQLPDPVIPHPYREIEVSRPDPNMFLEHEDAVTEHNTEVHNHVIHNYEQRSAAMEAGVPVDILRGIQQAAASMANSAEIFAAGPGDAPGGIPPGTQQFDISGRQSLVQELIQHHQELIAHAGREYSGRLDASLSAMAQKTADQMKKQETVQQITMDHQPFQNMHQKHLDAMQQLFQGLHADNLAARASIDRNLNQLNAEHEARMNQAGLQQQHFFNLLGQSQDRLAEIFAQNQGGMPAEQLRDAIRQGMREAPVPVVNVQGPSPPPPPPPGAGGINLTQLEGRLQQLASEQARQQAQLGQNIQAGILGMGKQVGEALLAARPANANPVQESAPQVTDENIRQTVTPGSSLGPSRSASQVGSRSGMSQAAKSIFYPPGTVFPPAGEAGAASNVGGAASSIFYEEDPAREGGSLENPFQKAARERDQQFAKGKGKGRAVPRERVAPYQPASSSTQPPDSDGGAAALRSISQNPRAAADLLKRIDEDPAPAAVPQPAEAPEAVNPKQRVAKPGAALPDRFRKNTRDFALKQRQSDKDKAMTKKREEEGLRERGQSQGSAAIRAKKRDERSASRASAASMSSQVQATPAKAQRAASQGPVKGKKMSFLSRLELYAGSDGSKPSLTTNLQRATAPAWRSGFAVWRRLKFFQGLNKK